MPASDHPSSLSPHRHPTLWRLGLTMLLLTGLGAIAMTDAPELPPTEVADPPVAAQADEGLHECVITFNTGRKITGFLIESLDDSVVIRLEGIDTTYRRKTISKIEFMPPVSERYRKLRESIEDTDIETRLVLVEWLRTRQAYTLAVEELGSILEVDPNNAHARTLHTWLTAHLALNNKPKDNKQPENDTTTRPKPKADAPPVPALSDEQINLMRVYELDLRDPPKMIVPDDVLRAVMSRHPEGFPVDTDERESYFDLPEADKLRILFTHRARDLYSQVKVLEDPPTMQQFKSTVHARNGWLVNACASTRCHGGADSGDFRLINQRPNSDTTAYTNFYIIDRYRLKDGTPLIDYENPGRSALLQLATRANNSLRPHPEIPLDRPRSKYRPIFRSSRDRKYQQAVKWINSIYKPRVEYDLGYPPPPTPDSDDGNGPDNPARVSP